MRNEQVENGVLQNIDILHDGMPTARLEIFE